MQMLIDETVCPLFRVLAQEEFFKHLLYMHSPTEHRSKLGTQKWAYGIDGHRPTERHDEMQNGRLHDLRSDFRVREHVTDTSPSHAEKRRPAVTADKPKDQIDSCRETIMVITAELKDATPGAGRQSNNKNKHIHMSGANATGNMHKKNRTNETR